MLQEIKSQKAIVGTPGFEGQAKLGGISDVLFLVIHEENLLQN